MGADGDCPGCRSHVEGHLEVAAVHHLPCLVGSPI